MANYRYDPLSAQDLSFLLGETATAHMHVGGVLIFELGDLATPEGGVDFDKIRRQIESLLPKIPRYRQKLQWTPIVGNPVWVDDADFDLEFHVRHTSLPRPGTLEQLKRLAGRIIAQQLDRERPLWEWWIVEGVEDDQFAMISKIHHCMFDCSAGADLATIMLNLEPTKDVDEPVRMLPKPAPSDGELLRDELLRRASLPLQLVRDVRRFRKETENLGSELQTRAAAIRDLVSIGLNPPDETPINGPLGPHRRFDWLDMPLADVKAVRKAAECTVNDVVLTTAAGAFREYLMSRGCDPGGTLFRASAPVSVRKDEERGQMGNRVSSWMIPLPIGEPGVIGRLHAIHEETQKLKSSQQALGVDLMMSVAEWTPPVLLSLGAQSVGGQVNTIITNVPGPQFPLYMLGARLRWMLPMVPLLENMGLGIALFSYDGRMSWGFNADYGQVPDLPDFVAAVARSFREFAEAVGVETSVGV